MLRTRLIPAIALTTVVIAACDAPPASEPRDTPTSATPEKTTAAGPAAPVVPSAAIEPGPRDGAEQLLAEPPAGWKELYATEREAFRLVEYVPEDSPVEWVEKISFESVGGAELPDPIEFAASISADQSKVCERFEDYNTFSGYENGYATTVRLFSCNHNPGLERGQVMLFKAITGNDAFYTITWAKRVPPFGAEDALPVDEAEVARWSTFLRRIKLCDPRAEAHPCPATESSETSEDVSG